MAGAVQGPCSGHVVPLHGGRASYVARRAERSPVPRGRETTTEEPLTFGQRLADRVTKSIGSWPLIIVQSVILLVWIVMNTIAWRQHWDPYPFILLNLFLSFQAAYAAPIIMMSQNRQNAKDREKAEADYAVTAKPNSISPRSTPGWTNSRTGNGQPLLDVQQQQLRVLTRIEALTRRCIG